jgi:hypothetical protein
MTFSIFLTPIASAILIRLFLKNSSSRSCFRAYSETDQQDKDSETSPKNTKLYFGLLLETKDLITSTMSLLQLFQEFNQEARQTITY